MELPDKEISRIFETADMILQDLILQDVASVLEVGCGDGRVSKIVCDTFNLTGIDIDNVRIKAFPGKKIIADISNLPMKNNKFDLVFSSEVLEHLDDEVLLSAISEISRVAKKYILITVPFEETLPAQWIKCSKCGHIFHAWGHVRRFNLGMLKKLFSDAPLIEKKYLSPKESRLPSLLYVIAKKVGNAWGTNTGNHTLCPECGSGPLEHEGNILGKILIRLVWRINRASPFTKPIWIGCLYQKRQQLNA